MISHSESEDHDQKGGEGLLEDSKVTKTFITGGKLKCQKFAEKVDFQHVGGM